MTRSDFMHLAIWGFISAFIFFLWQLTSYSHETLLLAEAFGTTLLVIWNMALARQKA